MMAKDPAMRFSTPAEAAAAMAAAGPRGGPAGACRKARAAVESPIAMIPSPTASASSILPANRHATKRFSNQSGGADKQTHLVRPPLLLSPQDDPGRCRRSTPAVGAIITIATDHGTLEFKTGDDPAQVIVSQQGRKVTVINSEANTLDPDRRAAERVLGRRFRNDFYRRVVDAARDSSSAGSSVPAVSHPCGQRGWLPFRRLRCRLLPRM